MGAAFLLPPEGGIAAIAYSGKEPMRLPCPLPSRSLLLVLGLGVTFALTGCRTGAFPQYPSDYREYAYIANSGSDTVTVLDLVHIEKVISLPVGSHPAALAASPTHNEVYAASWGGANDKGAFTIIDAEHNRVAATLSIGRQPAAIAVSSTGKRVYVANAGDNSVSVIDPASRQVLGVVGVGEDPGPLAVAPNDSTLVVANHQSGSISLLDLRGDALPKLRSSFAGCPGAASLSILPDSSKVFVACSGGAQVMVVGLKTLPEKKTASSDEENDCLLAMLDVGKEPVKLIQKPDGGEIFVADRGADTISEIATGTNEVGGASLIGSHPNAGVVSADNSLLWVANQDADTVAVYSVDDGKLVNTVHVGDGPGAVAFSADGHLLLAVDTRSGDVSVVRTLSRNLRKEPVYGSLFTLLPAGAAPDAIVDKAFRLPR